MEGAPTKKQRVDTSATLSLDDEPGTLADPLDPEEWINNPIFPPTTAPHVKLLVHTPPHPKTRFHVEKSLLMSMKSKVIATWVEDTKEDIPLTDFAPIQYETLFRLFLRQFDPHQIRRDYITQKGGWNLRLDGRELLKLSFRLDVPDIVQLIGSKLSESVKSTVKTTMEVLVECKLNKEAAALAERWVKFTFIPLRPHSSRKFTYVHESSDKTAWITQKNNVKWKGLDGSEIRKVENCFSLCKPSLQGALKTWSTEGRQDIVAIVLSSLFKVMRSDQCYMVVDPKPEVNV
jgi:hypothetical protein